MAVFANSFSDPVSPTAHTELRIVFRTYPTCALPADDFINSGRNVSIQYAGCFAE